MQKLSLKKYIKDVHGEDLEKNTVEDALKFANACGAICTTATGAGTALKSREQVLLLMKNEE